MVTRINETTPPFTILFRFNATDRDGDDVTFTLARRDSSNAENYFYVSQIGSEGVIGVRQDLRLDRPQTVYLMRLLASDGVNVVSANVTGIRALGQIISMSSSNCVNVFLRLNKLKEFNLSACEIVNHIFVCSISISKLSEIVFS